MTPSVTCTTSEFFIFLIDEDLTSSMVGTPGRARNLIWEYDLVYLAAYAASPAVISSWTVSSRQLSWPIMVCGIIHVLAELDSPLCDMHRLYTCIPVES